jgi:hypothetical protein
MKKSKNTNRPRPAAKSRRAFRAAAFASILLALGAVTAIASRYESGAAGPQTPAPAKDQTGYVNVQVGGKTLRVNAQTLQQGPLTQDQSQAIADALKGNKSTDGLVEVQNPDGSVSMDLQGRFKNVALAKRNDDGSISAACVDTSEAATAFLQNRQATTTVTRPTGKAALQQ